MVILEKKKKHKQTVSSNDDYPKNKMNKTKQLSLKVDYPQHKSIKQIVLSRGN
jgi:hypothetical protein